MRELLLVTALVMSSTSALADNEGKDALDCVAASTSGNRVTFQNRCAQPIFMIWCGNLKYTSKHCGDGPKGSYYTHLDNIHPGASINIVLADNNSRYQYGACYGRISFGNSGEYRDGADGSYGCLPTGRYRNQ